MIAPATARRSQLPSPRAGGRGQIEKLGCAVGCRMESATLERSSATPTAASSRFEHRPADLERSSATPTAASSRFEHRPADLVARPLVVQDELADRIRDL